jgi:AraC-like DNA-binding protein
MTEHVAPLPRNVLDAISSAGIDVARLAKAAGLTSSKLERGMTYAESDRFLTAAWEAIGDPAFGLVIGTAIKPELYSVVGFSALTSATLGAAFEKLIRYNRLVWGDFSEIVRSPGRATLRLVHVGPERPYTRAKVDMQLAGKVAFANRFTGVSIVPVAVTLRSARPTWASRYQDVFGCPVQFGCEEDSITFRQQDLDRPLISANADISPILERRAEEMLARTDQTGISGRVRVVLQRHLRGDEPQLARVAHELGMSMRTLQRRLSEEGARFGDLLDDVRHAMAAEYLATDSMNLMEMAFLLGFSDPNSFFRAFRRWTGTTPDAYRRQRHRTARQTNTHEA